MEQLMNKGYRLLEQTADMGVEVETKDRNAARGTRK